MKKYFFIVVFFLLCISATARHVAGGEIMYQYVGAGTTPGTSVYLITMRLFRDCESPGPRLESEVINVGFYSKGVLVTTLSLPKPTDVTTLSLNTSKFPCLVGDPRVCYQMAVSQATIVLRDTEDGYTVVRHGKDRIDYINNLSQETSVGSTYVTKIPGTNVLGAGHNSSPRFNVRDTALVCSSKKFVLDFGATDEDGDSLSYSFCEGYGSSIRSESQPPSTLTLEGLPYGGGFTGDMPLGAGVTIDPRTGIISGIVPPVGRTTAGTRDKNGYVVSVCITEWRNGKIISEHRKDFILKTQSCDFVEADLPDKIVQCKDTTIVHFENQSTSSAITGYLWEFGDKAGSSSTLPLVDFNYADTGRFMVRLTVHGPKGCVGVDSAEVVVYPGFKPGFGVAGACYFLPYRFIDSTTSKYGTPNSWRWNFGDASTTADISSLKNPTYKYKDPGTKNIGLVVSDSKGCIDSVYKDFVVRDKPEVHLPFKDTLICAIDTLAIPMTDPGTYSWSPNKNILFGNTGTPLVFPKDTTRYIVTLSNQGCTNSDTVTINVLQSITVELGKDSLICSTDKIELHPVSHGLQYQWASSTGEKLPPVKYPAAQPLVDTKYYVTANLGKCQARDTVTIRSVPYPSVIVGPDTAICIGSRAQLHSVVKAAYINWTPSATLVGFTTKNPVAGPSRTTTYVAYVRDTLGCPKIVSDSITVIVAPPVHAFAGNDTTATVGQPLRLQATGGVTYSWSPESYLSATNIADPTAIFSNEADTIRYYVRVTDQYGCFADDDVLVRIFRTGPDILVPTGFTPNTDGKNDVLQPVTIGIAKLNFFQVYNRLGQLLFNTTEFGKGWDGRFNGAEQPSGTYVFQARGVDYTGKVVYRKGTVVLIR